MSMGEKTACGRLGAWAIAALALIIMWVVMFWVVQSTMPVPYAFADGTLTPAQTSEESRITHESTSLEVSSSDEIASDEDSTLELDLNGAQVVIEIEDDETPLAAKTRVASGLHYLVLAGIGVTALYAISVCVSRRRFAKGLANYEGEVLKESPYNKGN